VLEQCLLSVKNEITKLRDEKAATERELESLAVHLNTVADCIRQRDRRYGNDLVLMDAGDVELKNVSNFLFLCKFSCFHGDVSLLGCDTMQ
jgi:tektin-2